MPKLTEGKIKTNTKTYTEEQLKKVPVRPPMRPKKAQVAITMAMLVVGFSIPIGIAIPTIQAFNSTISITENIPYAENNIVIVEKAENQEWRGAVIRTFSQIINTKQWYVEPNMEYMFSGWLVAYDKIKKYNNSK